MPRINHQEQMLHFLIWFLRRHIHQILSGLNHFKRAETGEIQDLLENILERVTQAEYFDAPIQEKIEELTQFKYFVQTLSGADIHGDEVFRRGPDVD
ncbi:MAG: hypothetical protein HY200_00560 [Nitrospirae bacterium]|nr:hypothetical protein [Nitrospirota bacterium]MBI3593429.1 hypothetical protein [Nitrospirota bacterium]